MTKINLQITFDWGKKGWIWNTLPHYQVTYSVNLSSWTHVPLNRSEETCDKSVKDKFKTKEPEFNHFPGVLTRMWDSRSVSVNELSTESQGSQDGKFPITFKYWSKGSLLMVGIFIWVSFTCMSSNSIFFMAWLITSKKSSFNLPYFLLSSILSRNIFSGKHI